MFAFENIGEYGSGIFIDNINIVANTTGLNTINFGNNVSVYPNPSSGSFDVFLNIPNPGQIQIRVYNVLGETISEVKENISTPKNFTFNVADQANGIYLVEVKTNDGRTVKKVMLNK